MSDARTFVMRAMHRQPGYRIVLDKADISPRINGRLIDLRLTEKRGMEADQLDLTLSDHDGQLAMPRRGVELQLFIGWQDEGLIDKGTFTVDEVEHSGTPDRLTLRARSADMRGMLPGKRTQSWHRVTVSDVVNTIAKRYGLTPKIADALGGIRIGHIDQTDESDLNFLTRLGERYDAIAAVKNGKVLFSRAGRSLTVSGRPLPLILLTRRDGDTHRYAQTDRDSYSGVKAYWNDVSGGKRQIAIVGSGDNAKQLRPTYASQDDAQQAAKAEWERIKRGIAEFDITLTQGRADVMPESPLRTLGFKADIDATDWVVTEVTHTLSDSGYITQAKCETSGAMEDGAEKEATE